MKSSMLKLLYKLLLDGGKVIERAKIDEICIFKIEPGIPDEYLYQRYGRSYGPFTVMIGGSLSDFFSEFVE